MTTKQILEYEVCCEMCDVMTDVMVYEIDEKPIFCPMCGAETESVSLE
jgi:hypothetical protein